MTENMTEPLDERVARDQYITAAYGDLGRRSIGRAALHSPVPTPEATSAPIDVSPEAPAAETAQNPGLA